ncbi:serine/threonine-protein kinase [Polyangium aurulentum]|uniref:serine/threonine-protein kinase n=1 Tax=Polyangium aurulentum TaxID=2567896 RepID=UPI00146D24E3|nr:serine/threonine-protein kinase [Polyangium aurulentum]UQA58174.1 serine/threonine protein kinase [Polyangium aurulentum]
MAETQAAPVSALLPLPCGSRVGDYIIEAVIGYGGYGLVHRAIHAQLGTAAAIKVLHAELASDRVCVARFAREIEIVERIRHPNVARVLDWGRLPDGRPYFIMELLQGESLDRLLFRRGRLTPEEVLSILEPIASALDAIHAESIVHRDVKPSNVFLCEEAGARRVVLLDFGVAKPLGAEGPAMTASTQTVGTMLWMAPEQLLAQPIDARTDVYALGILAYGMLTGRPPFDGEVGAISQKLDPRAAIRPSARARVPEALDEPVMRALAALPSDRPPSAGAFVAELSAALESARNEGPPAAWVEERAAVAAHAEVFVDDASCEEPDEELLVDLESVLPFLSAELSAAGLSVVMEAGNSLLMVAEVPDEPEQGRLIRRKVIEAAASAYGRLLLRDRRDGRVGIRISLHAGAVPGSTSSTATGGGLLEPGGWVPEAHVEGVLASEQMLEGVTAMTQTVPGVAGFFQVDG